MRVFLTPDPRGARLAPGSRGSHFSMGPASPHGSEDVLAGGPQPPWEAPGSLKARVAPLPWRASYNIALEEGTLAPPSQRLPPHNTTLTTTPP